MTRALLRRLRADTRGVTVIEFAVIAPVLCMLIMGLSDLAYRSYVQAMLSGAMQKAGRDSGIQGGAGQSAALDAKVLAMVRNVAKDATIFSSSRKSYASFGQIAPEQFDDNNHNNLYDKASECFWDTNGNNTWDADPGTQGQGGANDVVLYKMTIRYPRLFPLSGFLGWAPTQDVSATTILKNQPYAQQNSFAPKQVCP